MTKKLNVVVIGASGYTGAELLRLLAGHPNVQISALVADSNAGKPVSTIYPHLAYAQFPDMVKLDAVDFAKVDVAFCCLPHATTQEVVNQLPKHVVVIDVSADFRIADVDVYEQWYGSKHLAPVLQKEAVYALPELYRDNIKKTRIIACPGCYPTSMLLPLVPLVEAKAINTDAIIVDSKSGVSGAGRSAKVPNLYGEVAESVKPYSVGGHRHVAEVEQQLAIAADKEVVISFTPQVVPMSRGILSCIYVETTASHNADSLREILKKKYAGETFVKVHEKGYAPTTREVSGTNNAAIAVFDDRIKGRVVILSVIDNLLKGASGQAVQNMNLRFGFAETEGLAALSVFP